MATSHTGTELAHAIARGWLAHESQPPSHPDGPHEVLARSVLRTQGVWKYLGAMGSHDLYGKGLLRAAAGGKYVPSGHAVEVPYGSKQPARIDGVLDGIAVEV